MEKLKERIIAEEKKMKKIGIVLTTLFLCAVICACSKAESGDRPDVTLYGSWDGLGNSLSMIFDFDNSGKLCEKAKEVVQLKTPSKHINPPRETTPFGTQKFYVWTDKEGKDPNPTAFGITEYKSVKLPNGKEVKLWTFQRVGAGEKAVGSDSIMGGNIWSIGEDGTITKVGQTGYREVITPDGEKKTLLMHCGTTTGAKWTTDIEDKIFQEQNDRKLKQVGYVDWRVIQLPEGGKATILMTKGMSKGSKWAGRYNGKLYQDK